MNKINYKQCKYCNNTKNETNFYKGMDICKECLQDEFRQIDENLLDTKQSLLFICAKYNLYYDINIIKTIGKKISPNNIIGEYLKIINSLPQYSKFTYDDSVFKIKEENKKYNLIETLKHEENKLLNRLSKIHTDKELGDYKLFIRNLAEVVKLRQEEEKHINNTKILDNKIKQPMYVDVSRDKEQPTVIFYKGRIYHLYDVKIDEIVQYIKDITKGDDFEVYIELNDNCNMALADYLINENIEVKNTENVIDRIEI